MVEFSHKKRHFQTKDTKSLIRKDENITMLIVKKDLLPERFIRMYKRRGMINEKNGQFIIDNLNEKAVKILNNFIEKENQKECA